MESDRGPTNFVEGHTGPKPTKSFSVISQPLMQLENVVSRQDQTEIMTGKLGQKCDKVMAYHRDHLSETESLLFAWNFYQSGTKFTQKQIWFFSTDMGF